MIAKAAVSKLRERLSLSAPTLFVLGAVLFGCAAWIVLRVFLQLI
jgi:hypothetical protein